MQREKEYSYFTVMPPSFDKGSAWGLVLSMLNARCCDCTAGDAAADNPFLAKSINLYRRLRVVQSKPSQIDLDYGDRAQMNTPTMMHCGELARTQQKLGLLAGPL